MSRGGHGGSPGPRIRRALPGLLVLLLLLTAAAGAHAQGGGPARRGYLTGPAVGDPLEIGMGHLRRNLAELGLEAADLDAVRLRDRTTSAHNGLTHLHLQQELAGIEVVDGTLSLSVTADGRVLALRPRLVRDAARAANTRTPELSAAQAVAFAAAHLGAPPTQPVTVLERRGGPAREVLLSSGGVSVEPIPARLVYRSADPGGLRLAWSLFVRTPDRQHWWNLDVDAVDGAVLAQTDWILDDSYRVVPLPIESPDDGPRSLEVDPADPAASPFAWHDTDGAAGAEFTDTRGNNVHAQEDANDDDAGGFRPSGGPGPSFDFPFDPLADPVASQSAAITNLFYWNNVLHDLHYRYGFDEPSGNYQVNNYGLGGAGNDPVLADAQDGSGLNNANFSRAADGTPGRMQMFLFEFRGVVIHSPPELVQSLAAGIANFGQSLVVAQIEEEDVVRGLDAPDPPLLSTTDGCSAFTNPGEVSGKIALVDRGDCLFTQKVKNAQDAGAIAAIVVNHLGDEVFTMGGADNTVVIPSVLIGQTHGQEISAALGSGTVNVTLSPQVLRDASFDSSIIIHEYGHGVSIRLAGGPGNAGCLSQIHSAGMGEGWGDWWALALTAEEEDTPEQVRSIAAFSLGLGPNGPGIRNFPYSTDLAVNPQTFADIASTNRPHGVGEIWAQALWEVYWNLVGHHGFDSDLATGTGGNNLALQLVMDGLKMGGCQPTFLEARNAILDADLVDHGGANQCLIWQGFARRGMGEGANATSSNSTNVTEDFGVPAGCEPVCGNSLVDSGEACDDGGTDPSDGCSAACRLETEIALFGTAQGGSVTLTVDGVEIQVTTSSGESAQEVLQALADAILADPTLQANGTAADVIDGVLVTDGAVSALVVQDPGLGEQPLLLPALAPAARAALALLLLALAWPLARSALRRTR